MNSQRSIGETMYAWAKDLFPICRSITGPGVRQTLEYLQTQLPELNILSIASDSQVFDWTVPDEWSIEQAYIEDEHGHRIIDFKQHNLHIVGYSDAIDQWMDLATLQLHLHSLPEQANAIPYVTSYYKRNWGFCLTQQQRDQLTDQRYHVVIKSTLKKGVLNYAELLIKGETEQEILLSTYICHPSMANNELSGPVVTTALAQWLQSLKNTRYSYRIIFIPETIGSICYLSQHIEHLKRHTVAGFVVTCIGDNRTYSYLPSRQGNTLADQASQYVLNHYVDHYTAYSYLQRGSDERQYCSPGINLPVCSVMRSKYGEYEEYHTSLDDLSLISADGLQGGYDVLKKIIQVIEYSQHYQHTVYCEPQLGKRGLYPNLSIKNNLDYNDTKIMLDLLAYADGEADLLSIAQTIQADFFKLYQTAEKLRENGLLKMITKAKK